MRHTNPLTHSLARCAGSDNKIFVWNVGMGEVLSEIDFPDIPLSCAWNWDGSRVAVACKDHKLRVVEPRTGKFIRVSRSRHILTHYHGVGSVA